MKRVEKILSALAVLVSLPASLSALPQYIITNDGIGEIKIGCKVSTLPQHVEGLYDELQLATHENEEEYDCYNAVLAGESALTIIPYIGLSAELL